MRSCSGSLPSSFQPSPPSFQVFGSSRNGFSSSSKTRRTSISSSEYNARCAQWMNDARALLKPLPCNLSFSHSTPAPQQLPIHEQNSGFFAPTLPMNSFYLPALLALFTPPLSHSEISSQLRFFYVQLRPPYPDPAVFNEVKDRARSMV